MSRKLPDIDFFRTNLLTWATRNPRPMPWKGEKDPYKIWLSEIILQQTRVEQGWPYFEKFVSNYPRVQDLAKAEEDAVLKLWEGLGYYTRARNMHRAAKHIAETLDGEFPVTYEAIKSLSGVGDYTAAAIASFAYNLPHAVLDGNVYRVLARYYGIDTPTDLPAAKKQFTALAQQLLDPYAPGQFNQAIMDFGALCCRPAQPDCAHCPLSSNCVAFLEQRVEALPVRLKKAKKKERFFLYLKINQGGFTYLKKREGADIWQGLYEYPMLEVNNAKELKQETLLKHFFPEGFPQLGVLGPISPPSQQILTHQRILATFIEVHLPEGMPNHFLDSFLLKKCIKVPDFDVKKNFALPRVIVGFLEKNI